ncbi:claudin-4-like [Oncorhynchus kisutch]|uniref:claudin-4-like n=1 Tax=Oncorhynchus kisutch TaxID=8019 RepID=UPI0012DEE54D|nr:claudin-4-like [Oncorhynchus kisutch]
MGMDFVYVVEMGEVVGIALGLIGLILTTMICALPTWIEITYIAGNVATTKVVLNGLWMCCLTLGTGQTRCEMDNSMCFFPDLSNFWEHVLEPAKAMIPTAIILGVLGVMFSMVGAKCTDCIKDKTSQAKLIIIAGILFIGAGILILITVSLVAIFIINFPLWIEGKPELGASLYFGWVAAALLLIGGVTLCITVGVFGWMMGIFGWIVSVVSFLYIISILHPFIFFPEAPFRDIWMVLMTITSISSILGALGVMGSIFGTRCCNCIKSNRTRVKARFIVGIFFILAGILQLTTEFVIVHYLITDVHLQLKYLVIHPINWVIILAELSCWSACMLLIGGTILCCSIFKRNQPDLTMTQSTSR